MAKTQIPGHDKISKPTCTIVMGTGKESDVTATYSVVSCMVRNGVNRIPVAEVVIYDGSRPKRDFPLSIEERFIPGKATATIKLGYKGKEEVVFTGVIMSQSIKSPLDGPSTLKMELRDPIIKSTIVRKNKYFADLKDSEIIKNIMDTYSGVGEIDVTTAKHKEMVQYYCTDWDFVLSRAEANGMLVLFRTKDVGARKLKKGFNFKKPEFAAVSKNSEKEDSLKLTFGDNIVEIEADMDARDQYESVTGHFWDYSKQSVVKENSPVSTELVSPEEGDVTGKKLSDVLAAGTYLQQTGAKLLDEELQAWSEAKMLRSRMAKIKGRVRIYGTNVVEPGDVIVLDGLGGNFNKNAYVSEVIHSFSADSTWYTDIRFGYSDDWFYERYQNIMTKPASGLLPGIHGLMTGIVTDFEDKEGGEFRVRVTIPLIDKDDKGVWARVSAADAGPARGVVIRPEKEDEVLLGFINGDPRDPIILGVLYSKNRAIPAGLEADEKNTKKGWVTLGETKFLIDDTADKQKVTVETKKKNTIIISDADKSITIMDQNKNKIVMDDKGITIESDKDITMKAKGKITMTGQKDVTAESKTGKLIAKGSTGAEVTTSGKAVLKGSIVNIN